MENTKIIVLDEDYVAKLASADYAYNTKKDVITTYISSGLDTTTPTFLNYQAEMEKAYREFKALKADIETKYVLPEYKDVSVTWTVNYTTKELTIKVIAK